MKSTRLITLLMFAMAISSLAAASDTATVEAGRGDVSITIPASYDGASAAPLIVLLHGYGGTSQGVDAYLKLSALVDSYGFLLVAPDGLASPSDNFGMKNLVQLIDAIGQSYRVDRSRIYLVGHSNGGFMAHRMAREHPDTIAAIVSLAGTEDTELPELEDARVHVLQIHGTADQMIASAGGEIQGLGAYAGARDTMERWARRSDCSTDGRHAGTIDLVSNLEGAETTIVRWTESCRPGGSAELWQIEGGSHMPALSEHFSPLVVEWLLGHPQP